MSTVTLFPKFCDIPNPATEGIKYAGSKRKIIPYILRVVNELCPKTVFDGFSGSTRVSQALAASGYQVYANDIAPWSRVFSNCYLMNEKNTKYYQNLIDHLNALPGKDGWFTAHYGGEAYPIKSSPSEIALKQPWQKHNTQKLDAIREEIETLNLSEVEKCVAITSLVHALDKVDSTLGHFASYLREWSARSYNQMHLTIPHVVPKQADHAVFQRDIFDLLDEVEVDLAYLDPPYGSNNDKMPPSRIRYQAYYHIWASVCLFDKPPLFGKARRRLDSSDNVAASIFEEYRKNDRDRFIALEAIEEMLKRIKARHVILSYSSGGRSTATELNQVIQNVGKLLEVVEIDHKKHVMGNMRWTSEWVKESEEPNREFLFVIEK